MRFGTYRMFPRDKKEQRPNPIGDKYWDCYDKKDLQVITEQKFVKESLEILNDMKTKTEKSESFCP